MISFPHTILHFLSELLQNFAYPHTGNGRGRFVLVNIAVYHGEGARHFVFLCVQIMHARVPCSTGLAMLASVKQMHA